MEPENISPVSNTIPASMPANGSVENTSGQGVMSIIPEGVRGWSWGAFGFNWIWGLFNGTYIALLVFIPFVNLIMIFVLGIKGREWAWRNKRWDSLEHFNRVQRLWSLVWIWITVVLVGLAFLGIISSIILASLGSAHEKAYNQQQNATQQIPVSQDQNQ